MWHALVFGWMTWAVIDDTAATWKLLDTIAVGDKYLLPNANGNTVTFRPAKSQLQNVSGSIIPDVEGIYRFMDTNATWHLHAVDLQGWSRGMMPLLTDTFDNNLVTDSTTAPDFWTRFGDSADCQQFESEGSLHLRATTKGESACGLQVNTDPAYKLGIATTINPFETPVTVSIAGVSLDPSAQLSIALTSTGESQMQLHISNQTLEIRWRQKQSWISLWQKALPSKCNVAPRGNIQLQNATLAMSLRTAHAAWYCGGVGYSSAPSAHNVDWREFAPESAGSLGLQLYVMQGSASIEGISAVSTKPSDALAALLSPVPNLSGGGRGEGAVLGKSHSSRLLDLGYLDPTQPPFNADPTGHIDSTARLQAAIEYARRNYLAVWLPSGEYLVTDTIVAKQTERLDAIDGKYAYWQQARYVPTRMVGSKKGLKPVLVLAPGSFTDAMKPKPVVWIWMQNSKPGSMPAPYHTPAQPNANCNQIFEGIDIRISPGNAGAIGIRARGAQMTVVQDVTVFAGDGLVGLSGGSGSGGSHYGVRVEGGRYGVDLTTAQPGPVLTGITLVNQSCSALVYSGLQTLTVVGLHVLAPRGMKQPVIITGCTNAGTPPDWGGTLFTGACALPQFVQPSVVQQCGPTNSGAVTMVDSIIDLGAGASNVAIAAAASVYLVNVFFRGVKLLAQFHGGHHQLNAPPGDGWAVVAEFAHGVSRQATTNGHKSTFSSLVHILNYSTMQPSLPVAKGPWNTLRVGIERSATPPPTTLTSRHLYNSRDPRGESWPSFENALGVVAADFGVVADGRTDCSDFLDLALKHAASLPSPGAVVLGRGVHRVSRPLILPPGVSLLGAGLHLTTVCPTSVGFPDSSGQGFGTAVLQTTGGSSLVSGISVSVWAHLENVTAVRWDAAAGSLWLQNHVNRMDECGITGGTPRDTSSDPTPWVPACRPRQRLGHPLVLVTGGGSFFNFYNEDAMGAMVAHDYQLPSYRHMLVANSTQGVRLYHFNPEHSVANANSELRDSSGIRVYGTKSEGHTATLWVRNCSDVMHSGHSGNAVPLSCLPSSLCSKWHPSPCACTWGGTPSLFRVQGCRNCRFANLWSYHKNPPGFVSLYGEGVGAAFDSEPMDNPVVVALTDELRCVSEAKGELKCV